MCIYKKIATPRKWWKYADMVILNGRAISKNELTLEDLKELGISIPGIKWNKTKENWHHKVDLKKDKSYRQSGKLKELKIDYNVTKK